MCLWQTSSEYITGLKRIEEVTILEARDLFVCLSLVEYQEGIVELQEEMVEIWVVVIAAGVRLRTT